MVVEVAIPVHSIFRTGYFDVRDLFGRLNSRWPSVTLERTGRLKCHWPPTRASYPPQYAIGFHARSSSGVPYCSPLNLCLWQEVCQCNHHILTQFSDVLRLVSSLCTLQQFCLHCLWFWNAIRIRDHLRHRRGRGEASQQELKFWSHHGIKSGFLYLFWVRLAVKILLRS